MGKQDQDNLPPTDFHINVDDAILKIQQQVTGQGGGGYDSSNAPSGLVDPKAERMERMVREGIVKPTQPLDEHIDWNGVAMKIKPGGLAKAASATNNPAAKAALAARFGAAGLVPMNNNTLTLNLQNRIAERYTPIMEELSRFKFASGEDKREAQMKEVAAAIRNAIRKLAVREVVANTKNLYPNAEKCYQTETGLRVVYAVDNHKVSVTAEGDFTGDEIVCLEQEGATVTAYVARQGSEGFQDLTGNYTIKMEPI